MAVQRGNVVALPHHEQNAVCSTRPAYRESRRRHSAVKVYTISSESKYLLVQGVPAVGVRDELGDVFAKYGELSNIYPLDGYPCEEFTETYLVQFAGIQSARIAKKRMDDSSFFGGVLHICYAPEFETVQDTREKLLERQNAINTVEHRDFRKKRYTSQVVSASNPPDHVSEGCSGVHLAPLPKPPETYIWAGREYVVEQPVNLTPENPVPSPVVANQRVTGTTSLVPRQLAVKRKADTELKTEPDNETACAIRAKLNKVSVANVAVTFSRRKPR